MKKRIISIALCLVMTVSLLPMLKPTVAEASGARVDYDTTAHTATVTWDAVADASFYDVILWNKYDGSGWYQPYVGPKVNAGQPLTYTFAASMFSGIADDGLTDQFKIAVRAWDSDRFHMETMETPVFTSTLPTLAQPDVVLDDSGILTWSAVPDANKYNVSLYVFDTGRNTWSAVSEDNRTADLSMDFSSLMVPGYQYKGRVRAIDNAHAHRSSGNRDSNTVTMPGEAVVGGVLEVGIDYSGTYPYTATAAWDGVQGAAAYWVTLYGMSDGTGVYPAGRWMAMDFAQKIEVKPGQLLEKEFDSSWFTDNAYEGIGNTYRVTVKAVNAAGMEIASGVSRSFDSNVPQLSAPTVALDEKGVLTVSEVANANDYHYSIYARNPGSGSQKGSLVTTSSSSSRTFDLRSRLTPGTEYVITAYARDNTNHYKTSASGTTGWFTWKEPDSHLFDINVTGREVIYHNLRLDWNFPLTAASYEITVYHQADNASWVQEGETVVVEGTKNYYSLSRSYFQTAFDDPAFERSFANYYKIEVVARDGSGEELQTGGLYYTSTIDVIETPEVTLDGVTGYAEWGSNGNETAYALYERPVGSSSDGTKIYSGSISSSMIGLSAYMRMGYEYRVSACQSSYYQRTSGTAYSPWVERSQKISTVNVPGEVVTGIPMRSCLSAPAHSTIRVQSWTMNGQNVTDATYVVPGIQRVTLVLQADDGYVFDKNIGNLDVTVCGNWAKTAHVSEDGKQLYITSQDFNNCDHSLSVADYEYDADQHWKTCSVCGAKYGNAWHDMVLVPENNVYRCSACGYEKENSTKTLVKHVYIANQLGDTTGGYISRDTIHIVSNDYDNFSGTTEAVTWYRDNLSTPATEDYFRGGSTYYVRITARTQNPQLCYMNSSTVFDAGENSACQPMGKPTVSSDGTQITQTFRVTLKDKEIDYVRFNGWPQVGDRLDTCTLDLTINDATHINASVQWYMNGKAVPASTVLIPGVAYAQVTLYADPGYCFAEEMRHFSMMETITDYTRSSDGKYLTFTSPVLNCCNHSLNENDTYEHDSGDINGGRHWITCSVCGGQINGEYHSFPETTYHGTTTTMTCTVCGYSQVTSTNNGRKLVSTVTTESYGKYSLAAGSTPYTLGLKYGANPDIGKNDERSAWYESDRTTLMTGTLQQGKTYYLKMVVYAPSKFTKYFDSTTQFVRGGSDALVAVGSPIVDPVDDSFITQWYKLYVAQLGDVNGDGDVDSADLTKLLRHVAKIEIITDSGELDRANVDGIGNIDAADVTALAKILNP